MSFKKLLFYYYRYGNRNGYCVEVEFNRYLKIIKRLSEI